MQNLQYAFIKKTFFGSYTIYFSTSIELLVLPHPPRIISYVASVVSKAFCDNAMCASLQDFTSNVTYFWFLMCIHMDLNSYLLGVITVCTFPTKQSIISLLIFFTSYMLIKTWEKHKYINIKLQTVATSYSTKF